MEILKSKNLLSILLLLIGIAYPNLEDRFDFYTVSGGDYNSVILGNGTFVAVGSNGNVITSNDGKTWEKHFTCTPNTLNSVIFNGSEYFAVGNNGTLIISENGFSWINVPLPTQKNLNDIVWTGTTYVIVGDSGTVLISSDGRNWDSIGSISYCKKSLESIAYDGKIFWAVGDTAILSGDGVSWIYFTGPAPKFSKVRFVKQSSVFCLTFNIMGTE